MTHQKKERSAESNNKKYASSALLTAWFAYIFASAIFWWIMDVEHDLSRFAGQIVAATVAIYLLAKHTPQRRLLQWSATGFALTVALLLLAPAGSLAESPAALDTLTSLGTASLLLPVTYVVVQVFAEIAHRVLRSGAPRS